MPQPADPTGDADLVRVAILPETHAISAEQQDAIREDRAWQWVPLDAISEPRGIPRDRRLGRQLGDLGVRALGKREIRVEAQDPIRLDAGLGHGVAPLRGVVLEGM